jgi:hypothetical protein
MSTVTTVPTDAHIQCIVAFNNNIETIFASTDDAPDGKTPISIALDISFSMNTKKAREQACIILAELTKDTNAEGAFTVPEPSGNTALIDAAAELARASPESQKFIITDGHDNEYEGDLVVGYEGGSTENVKTFPMLRSTTKESIRATVDHLEHVMGNRLFLVGLGKDVDTMTKAAAGKRATVVQIDRNATAREVVASLRSGRAIQRAGGDAKPLTLSVDESVKDLALSIPEAEMKVVNRAAKRVHIATSGELTFHEAKQVVDTANELITNPVVWQDNPKLYAALCFFATLCVSSDDALPVACLFGKHCGLLVEPNNSGYKRALNQLISKLCDGKFFEKAPAIPKEGAQLEIDGRMLKFAGGTSTYHCVLNPVVVEKLAADATFANKIEDAFERVGATGGQKRGREEE